MDHFLDELNKLQKAAATATEGPIMIIAGAGSGKTRVLTYRIAHIMEKGVDAFNILSLTFTNKAAKEMKERIGKLVGQKESKNLWMGTFHSVFAKILRMEAEKLGYPHNFTIYDTDDSKGVIKDILKQFNLDDKVYKASLVLNRISDAKNKLVGPLQYLNNPVTQQEDLSSRKPLLGKIYEAYQKRNFKAGAMDFDDLLFQTNVLLRDFPEVLYKYQNKFRYILVDEYQDTNFSQYLIIKQLAARFQNICVVGDDAQSIYAFRGANIQNILNFEKDYPDLKMFKLEQNYRSTKTIVGAANQIIANNKDQFEKNVFTENDEGQKLRVVRASTDSEEGQKIASNIYELKKSEGANNKDFAILYRTNAQSRSFEEALRRLNIAYKIYGGLSFYQRKEVKDVLAYFRLSINSNDEESLRRIINYPARGIGQSTIDKITIAAAEHDVSMWTVISHLKDFQLGINGGITAKIVDFVAQIQNFSLLLPHKDAYEMGNHMAVNSGIVRELFADKTPEGANRYENVQELLNGLKDFSEQERTPQEDELSEVIKNTEAAVSMELIPPDKSIRTLDEFMQEITLLTTVDKEDEKDTDNNKVSMMTIHAAKGLEFPFVYIVGMEENLFPSQLSINNRADLEEERRLFYVAVTRAEKQATLSYAGMRYRYGNVTYCEPSRFIDEIDDKYLDFAEEPESPSFSPKTFDRFREAYQQETRNQKTLNFQPKQKKLISLNNASRSGSGTADLSVNQSLQKGDQVYHEKFGSGEVISLEGPWPETKATIQFAQGGIKSLLLKFAKLTKQ